jgi:hypothetical protein
VTVADGHSVWRSVAPAVRISERELELARLARQRPMSERLELALSWNAVATELRAGLVTRIPCSNQDR